MRRISAKIISKDITNGTPDSPNSSSDLVLRIYPPQKFLDSTHNTIKISVFKNGSRVYSYSKKLAKARTEIKTVKKYGFLDINLTMREARELSSAVKKGTDNKYESFMVISPDKMAGEIYKLSITETDQLVIGYPTSSLASPFSVTKQEDLPSRGGKSLSFIDDPFQISERVSRNKNNMSNYDNNVSISYYLVDKSTIRIALTNLPVGYKRVEVLAQKDGQINFNADSIKKIGESQRNAMSNWFFDRISEKGNGFSEAGGYIIFDIQMFADERNTIIERVNKVSQNFFRNARNQDGQLQSQPVTGLLIFPEPIVNAGELANIRIILHSDLGRSKTYTIPLKVSTMGYSEPRILFSSNPNRLNRAFETRNIMTSNPINESNESIFRERINQNDLNSNDIFIDLNVNISGQAGIPGAILDIGGSTEDSGSGGEISTRTGGTFLVAFVTRYDSITGNTFDLGFTAKDKFIDRIANLENDTSLSNVIGSTFGGIYDRNAVRNFLNIVADKGLTLVYNFEFYEVTPEMLGAFLSAESVTDETAAPLLSNVGNTRTSEGRDFNLFISNLLRARTPIQTSSLSFEYSPKAQAQPNINIKVLEKQQNTNVPFYEISGQITNSIEHIAFIEVFRIEESRILKLKVKNESSIPSNFASKEIKLGVVDVSTGRFSINDFTPKDNIEGNNRKKERSIKTYYKLIPYGYILNNGLLTNSFRRFDSEIIVER